MTRAFLFILDSFGIGGAADAASFGDEGANTLANTANRVGGLGKTDSGASYDDIDFGVHLRADGTWEVLELGAPKGNFGNYLATDRFRVEVRGGTVRYLQNGVTAYTSTITPVYPLHVDTSFDTANGGLAPDQFLH